MIGGLNHIAIAVPDLEAACAQFATLFGVAASAPMTNPAQRVRLAYLDLGNAKIELLAPLDSSSPIAKFLEKNPRGGLHHFCVDVHDVESAVAQIESAGGQMAGGISTNVNGETIAFVHPRSACGALVELEAHPPELSLQNR